MFFSAILETASIALIPIFVSLLIDIDNTINSVDNILIQNIINKIDPNDFLIFFSIFLASFYFLKNIFVLFVVYLENLFFFKFKTFISTKIFSIYIDKKYNFHTLKSPSELLRNIIQESANLSNILLYLLSAFREIMVFLTLFSLLVYLNPLVTLLIFFLLLSFSFIFIKYFKNKILVWGIKSQDIKKDLLLKINDVFNSIKFIKISNSENLFKKNFNNQFLKNEKYSFYTQFLSRSVKSYFEIFAIILISLLVIILKINNFNFSNFLVVMSLVAISMIRVLPIFNTVVSCITNIRFTQPSLNVIYNELKNDNYTSDDQTLNSYNKKIKLYEFISLDLVNVNFNYVKDIPILKNININIKKKDIIGIIGKTGCGKTSILDIMLGLQKPDVGNLIINNRKFNFINNKIPLKVGYVPQNVFLLDDTIINNLIVDYETKDEKIINKINTIIKLVNLSNLIERIPNGLDTIIGNNGIKLSGGEKQRIGIARAILSDPDIIFLDEATSSLDIATEKKIMDNLLINFSNLTFVIIAHRLTTLNKCNKVHYIENGTIKHTATIQELIKLYPELSINKY